MLVKDLISELQKYNQELPVRLLRQDLCTGWYDPDIDLEPSDIVKIKEQSILIGREV